MYRRKQTLIVLSYRRLIFRPPHRPLTLRYQAKRPVLVNIIEFSKPRFSNEDHCRPTGISHIPESTTIVPRKSEVLQGNTEKSFAILFSFLRLDFPLLPDYHSS
jgi:hypothetical protein